MCNNLLTAPRAFSNTPKKMKKNVPNFYRVFYTKLYLLFILKSFPVQEKSFENQKKKTIHEALLMKNKMRWKTQSRLSKATIAFKKNND